MRAGVTPRRARSRRGSGEELRAEILAAATALLLGAETSSEVSTRAVAEAVGVSVMSIYHHFVDKQALLDAVAREVFTELDRVMESAAASSDDPLEALCAQASAYVQFALDHPAPYRYATMERPRCDGRASPLDNLTASMCTRFETAVTRCLAADALSPDGAPTIALDVWTALHGAATLLIAHASLPCDATVADRILRSAIGQAAVLSPTIDGGGLSPGR